MHGVWKHTPMSIPPPKMFYERTLSSSTSIFRCLICLLSLPLCLSLRVTKICKMQMRRSKINTKCVLTLAPNACLIWFKWKMMGRAPLHPLPSPRLHGNRRQLKNGSATAVPLHYISTQAVTVEIMANNAVLCSQ